MSDLSIDSSRKIKGSNHKSTKNYSFSAMEKEYETFFKKSSKTDFANSPVLLEQELTMLAKMKEIAEKQGLQDKLAVIKDREQAIYTQLANKSFSDLSNVYYSPISFKGGKTPTSLITPEKYVEQVSSRLDGIELDEKSKELANIMLKNSYSPESTSYILKKSFDDDFNLPQEKFDAIQMLAENGIASSVIPQVLDEISPSFQDVEDENAVNLNLCKNLCEFKQAGLDDLTSLNSAKFLELGFQSPEKVKKAIIQMSRRNIGFDSIMTILNALKVYDNDAKAYFLDMGAVQSVLKCKKSMTVTRENERKESDNPIRQLGVSKMYSGSITMIMKDGKITYIQPEEGETVVGLMEKYNKFVSENEDKFLCDFVQKYKMKDGSIDAKYARILSSLRNSGFSNAGLLDIIDFCVKNDGTIDIDKIEKISVLKQAGTINEDVLVLFNSCNDQKDLENAATLTAAVIDANTVSQLLPLIRNNSDSVEFIEDFSPVFQKKEHLLEFAKQVGLTSEKNDENAMNVAYKLSNILFNENKNVSEEEFLSTLERVINLSKNPDEEFVSDEADGIISVMSEKGNTLDVILSMLEKVKDFNGKYNENLSDIVWYMTVQDASLDQINYVLNCCKNSSGTDEDMSSAVVILLTNKVPIEQIIKTVSEN